MRYSVFSVQYSVKLTDADGEQLETQHWIETTSDCLYISDEVAQELLQECSSIEKMLNSMISKAASFCKKPNT
jgi:four helix bundle protein